MNENKINIRQVDGNILQDFLIKKGQKKFRKNQIEEWLWENPVISFSQMTNLSLSIRKLLEDNFFIDSVKIDKTQISNDGTIKNSFNLYDDNKIEGVIIPSPKRMTACISSQVGCSLSCKFCATGKLSRKRNLSAGEIFDQVVLLNKQALKEHNKPLSNIVYMGMGEPLLNYSQVKKSTLKITSEGLGLSTSRITISTAGIAKMIKQLADDKLKVKLALSLHAANDEKRNKIMPINKQNSLSSLKESLLYYYEKTKQFITLEYIIFKNFNDKIVDAKELTSFTKDFACKVNIIEYNSIGIKDFEMASEKNVVSFVDYLKQKNVVVNIRRSRGKDIDAACGQLANK